jgi:HD superfamily phosphohydrolase
MDVVLKRLLQRARILYEQPEHAQNLAPQLLIPFFKKRFTLDDYLKLDDGVLNTYFIYWLDYPDQILNDLANRFLSRRPFKSVRFTTETERYLPKLQTLTEQAGYDATYYTAVNNSFDLPYDAYDPSSKTPKTQIEIMQSDGTLEELSSLSPLVAAISGKFSGDERFYFPKEMLANSDIELFQPIYQEFKRYINNGSLQKPTTD